MRLMAYQQEQHDRVAVHVDRGLVDLDVLARAAGEDAPATLDAVLQTGGVQDVRRWLSSVDLGSLPLLAGGLPPAPLLRRPPKILGVGLNYEAHAGDLGETRPDEPATFMKPSTSIIGTADTIRIPRQSERTTGEAELGLIVGEACKDVAEEDALDVLAGVTTIIDMTAEDILQRNPRFLTRAKSFETFLVLGPDLVTLDEVPPLEQLQVNTILDGEVARHNTVANMLHGPQKLVAFFSSIMPLEPGDVISTGTPGAVVLREGSVVGCTIPHVGAISCRVEDDKERA